MAAQHFVQTASGEFINARYIVAMRPHRGGMLQTVITIDGGNTGMREEVAKGGTGMLADRLSGEIVPAAPGHFTLRFWPDPVEAERNKGAGWVEKLAVVAWRVEDGQAYPVTIDSPDEAGIDPISKRYVLTPTGEVEDQGNCTYETIERWEAEMRRKAAGASS